MTTDTQLQGETLLPCPNPECRSEKVVASNDFSNYYVYCSECFLRGPRESTISLGARWNNLPRVSTRAAVIGPRESTPTDSSLTVEQALVELREMFPEGYRRIEWVEVDGPEGRMDESSVLINVYEERERPLNGYVHEYAPTLSEAMAQVRKWKQEQE